MLRTHNFSDKFLEAWSDGSKTLDTERYEACTGEWRRAHERRAMVHYVLAILLFCVGLWAVSESAVFMSVLLIALAANSNRQSSHHTLVAEIMSTQRMLAMLMNGQHRSQDK